MKLKKQQQLKSQLFNTIILFNLNHKLSNKSKDVVPFLTDCFLLNREVALIKKKKEYPAYFFSILLHT